MKAFLVVVALIVSANAYCFFEPFDSSITEPCVVGDPCSRQGFTCTDPSEIEGCTPSIDPDARQYTTTFHEFFSPSWCADGNRITPATNTTCGTWRGLSGNPDLPCVAPGTGSLTYSACQLGGPNIALFPGDTFFDAVCTSFEVAELDDPSNPDGDDPMSGGWSFTDADTHRTRGENGATIWFPCFFLDGPVGDPTDGGPSNSGSCVNGDGPFCGSNPAYPMELSSGDQVRVAGSFPPIRGSVEKTIDTAVDVNYELSFWVTVHPDAGETTFSVRVPGQDGKRFFVITPSGSGRWDDEEWTKITLGFRANSMRTTFRIRDESYGSQGHSIIFTAFKIVESGECCDCEAEGECADFLVFESIDTNNPIQTGLPNSCTYDQCSPGIGCVHINVREAALCYLAIAPPPVGWPDAYLTIGNQLPPENAPLAQPPAIQIPFKRNLDENLKRNEGSDPPSNSTWGWWFYSCQCGRCVFSQYYPAAGVALQVSYMLVALLAAIFMLF